MLMDMPYKIANSICFNIILYFMTNLRHEERVQQEEEERSRLATQVGHEIQNDVEAYRVRNLVRHIHQHGRDSLGSRVVKSVS